MKWYHLNFSNSDLVANKDEKFVNQFVKLLHTSHHPNNLALYSLKFQTDAGLVYYTSAPDDLAYKLKELLAHYNSHEVSRPNLKVLTIQLGKSGILEETKLSN
ncbi:MAG: hypothetical protein IPJ23_07515 [Ignavibacteriales bacterium]|nr:hypothetical protein [Ignavibacteriales bacterium]